VSAISLDIFLLYQNFFKQKTREINPEPLVFDNLENYHLLPPPNPPPVLGALGSIGLASFTLTVLPSSSLPSNISMAF
jgi:hypothetical protein